MEIPALVYFSCWSIITIAFLSLGFKSLNHEDNNKAHFSPLVIFLLQRSLTTYVCHSSTYALVHRPHSKTSLTTHLKISIIGFLLPSYVYFISGPIPLYLIFSYAFLVIALLLFFMNKEGKELDLGLCVDLFIRLTVFTLTVKEDRFLPIFVVVVSFFTAGVSAIFDDAPYEYDHIQENVVSEIKKKRNFVEIGCWISSSLVFHFLFVRIKSFSDVLELLCFAVVCIGCIAMVMPRRDFGVLDIIVTNVLIGCVNEFDVFAGPTLFAFVASVVLFVLHPKVRSVNFVKGRDVVLW